MVGNNNYADIQNCEQIDVGPSQPNWFPGNSKHSMGHIQLLPIYALRAGIRRHLAIISVA